MIMDIAQKRIQSLKKLIDDMKSDLKIGMTNPEPQSEDEMVEMCKTKTNKKDYHLFFSELLAYKYIYNKETEMYDYIINSDPSYGDELIESLQKLKITPQDVNAIFELDWIGMFFEDSPPGEMETLKAVFTSLLSGVPLSTYDKTPLRIKITQFMCYVWRNIQPGVNKKHFIR